jgi:hypothetical protein
MQAFNDINVMNFKRTEGTKYNMWDRKVAKTGLSRKFHRMFGCPSIKMNNESSPLLRNVILLYFSNIGEMLEHSFLPTVINDFNK